MIDTTSSDNSPIIQTMGNDFSEPSLYCDIGSTVTIQRDLPKKSYSWSDIANVIQDDTTAVSTATTTTTNKMEVSHPSSESIIVSQEDTTLKSTSPTKTLPTTTTTATKKKKNLRRRLVSGCHRVRSSVIKLFSSSSSPSEASAELADGLSSSLKSTQTCATAADDAVSIGEVPHEGEPPTGYSVRFSPLVKTRTYSVVLGDHPYCEDGLAIDLGWDYIEQESEENPKESTSPNFWTIKPRRRRSATKKVHESSCQRHGGGICCRRRSYLSRKRLLLEVGGCTREQLLEAEFRYKNSTIQAMCENQWF